MHACLVKIVIIIVYEMLYKSNLEKSTEYCEKIMICMKFLKTSQIYKYKADIVHNYYIY